MTRPSHAAVEQGRPGLPGPLTSCWLSPGHLILDYSVLSVSKTQRGKDDLRFPFSSGTLEDSFGDSPKLINIQNPAIWQMAVLRPTVRGSFKG